MINNPKSLLIVGAGGHGKVVAETAIAAGYSGVAFLDQCYPARKTNGHWPIVGQVDASIEGQRFLAVGDNKVRAALWSDLNMASSPKIIHPAAVVSGHAELKDGVLVVAGAVVNVDAEIGKGTILNTSSSVDHDCTVGDFVHISVGARLAGGVVVGDRSWIGIGAVVKEGVKIGADVMVGAGAVVISNVPDGETVIGVPARAFGNKHAE